MNTKRVATVVVVCLAAIVASSLLMAALASAETDGARSLSSAASSLPEIAAPPVEGIVTGQAVSVTFPPGDWPWYAQPEISVHPEPPIAHHPTDLCAEVVNLSAVPRPATIEFSVANFGIGTPFGPVGIAHVEVPPGAAAAGCVVWVPPHPGHWCIQARLVVDGEPDQISQRNVDIWEPLVPEQMHILEIPVGPLEAGGHVTFALNNHLGWDVQLVPPELDLPPGGSGVV
jgi:hypothetical protein